MKYFEAKRHFKAAAAGLLAVVGLAGLPNEAPAFQFNNGDLVLAIFGNGTEFYYDIGTKTSLLAPGALNTFDVSAAFAAGAGVVGGIQTQWTIIGQQQGATTSSTYIYAGSQNNAATLFAGSPTNSTGTNSLITSWDAGLLLSTGATPAGPGAQVFLPSSDPHAFTNPSPNGFGLGGTLGGTFPDAGMQGSIGSLLNMIQGLARGSVLSDAGQAVLTAGGQLTICGGAGCSVAAPVPVPAAVVLFASGLIGLVGIARRTGMKSIV